MKTSYDLSRYIKCDICVQNMNYLEYRKTTRFLMQKIAFEMILRGEY